MLRPRTPLRIAGSRSIGSLRGLLPIPLYLAASHVHDALKSRLLGAGEPPAPRVSDVLRRRRADRSPLYTIHRDASALDALREMEAMQVKCLVVVGDAEPCDGVLTETDFIRRVALRERSPRDTPVHAIMTPMAATAFVFPDNTVSSCMEIMAAVGCHHLPVLTRDTSRLTAVLAMGEILGLTRDVLEANRAVGLGKIRTLAQDAESSWAAASSQHGSLAHGDAVGAHQDDAAGADVPQHRRPRLPPGAQAPSSFRRSPL